MIRVRLSVVLGAVAAAAAAVVLAGPLDPPAGPVAPTGKTLTEVEPRTVINSVNTPGDAGSVFRITQAGSYYLTGNVTGVGGKTGIVISASNVTIDLNGFALQGVTGSLTGIAPSATGFSNVIVRNGSVSGWGQSGIDLGLGDVENTLIESVIARSNGSFGLRTGTTGVVRFCTVTRNGTIGIIGYNGTIVESCFARLNTEDGIAMGPGGQVRGCTARDNGGNGISAGLETLVVDCVAHSNDAVGISGFTGSTVQRCVVGDNAQDGILVGSRCLVTDNVCNANGLVAGDGAGIHAAGSDNRIEGNNCTAADRGVDIDGTGNIIVRNTCSGNTTNWDVAAGNVCLVVQGLAGAAILGNAGGAAPGSTDPNANFTY